MKLPPYIYHLKTCHLLLTSSLSFIGFFWAMTVLHITGLQKHLLGLHFSNMEIKTNFQKLHLNNQRATISSTTNIQILSQIIFPLFSLFPLFCRNLGARSLATTWPQRKTLATQKATLSVQSKNGSFSRRTPPMNVWSVNEGNLILFFLY